MILVKRIAICLWIGLVLGYVATRFGLGETIGFSPYIITLPTSLTPLFTGAFKPKKK